MASLEQNSLCINVDEFHAYEFMNMMYVYYKEDALSEIDFFFEGDSDFRITTFKKWIFIEVENKHQDMVRLLKSYPVSMTGYSTNTTKCALFKHERGLLDISDFDILRHLWKLHTDIKKIEIMSHNITFRRSTPKRLQILCLCTVDKNILASLPSHVLERLEGLEDLDLFDSEGSEYNSEWGRSFRFDKNYLMW